MGTSIFKRNAPNGQTYVVLKMEAAVATFMYGTPYIEDEMVPSQAERFARELLRIVDEVKKADGAKRMYKASRFYP